MARLDTTQPPLVPKMVRLDPNDWDRLEAHGARLGFKASVLLRNIVGAALDTLDADLTATPE